MDLARFIQVYIVQGVIVVYYLVMGLKILKKDTKKTNFLVSSFFLFLTAGFSINLIYANIFQEDIVRILHFITITLNCFAEIFLLLLDLMHICAYLMRPQWIILRRG